MLTDSLVNKNLPCATEISPVLRDDSANGDRNGDIEAGDYRQRSRAIIGNLGCCDGTARICHDPVLGGRMRGYAATSGRRFTAPIVRSRVGSVRSVAPSCDQHERLGPPAERGGVLGLLQAAADELR